MDVIAMQAAFVLGLTNIVGKLLNDADRDKYLPIVALLFGVASEVFVSGLSPASVMIGAVLGGTTTGLYGAAKSVQATPVVVEDRTVEARAA